MTRDQTPHDGARDFDFLIGNWRIRHRRLRQRLVGSSDWDEFEGTSGVRALPAGLGNQDELRFDYGGEVTGLSFRFYDPAARRWSIYWIDSRRRVVDAPLAGSFAGDTGVFEGEDVCEGRPVRVRFLWTRAPRPRWQQPSPPTAARPGKPTG
jgi:hypothetical protein